MKEAILLIVGMMAGAIFMCLLTIGKMTDLECALHTLIIATENIQDPIVQRAARAGNAVLGLDRSPPNEV